ncbi:hypothetical protein E2562_034449 [Oryza meyeriana var. granulata]|uniref:Uncharacterized protein n=1 Tax=Oryza meyeriana var. granulata TaxID=110450 RepID=A0A6G1CUS2_9ORYZ|nr:hypothetical protein E2562_034449 [Oryza meyeriana var. granulata]
MWEPRVADDADGHAGGKSIGESEGEMGVSIEEEVRLGLRGDDEAVDTEHFGHDDRDDRLHDELRAYDPYGGDADTALGGALGDAHAYVKVRGQI